MGRIDPRRAGARAARARGQRGFTLLELLIAAALLAVLAVLSWRGLDSVLTARGHIVRASDELRSLTMAFSQMDEDLRRSWPVRLLGLRVPPIAFTVSGEQARVTLELLRETSGASEVTQVQRVAYRLRDGVLERGFGAWVAPAASGTQTDRSAQGATEATSLIWQPILADVAALEMQGWISGRGWIAASALAGQLPAASTPSGQASPGAASPGTAPPVVTGMLVRVVRLDGSVLVRVFPVKD